MKVYSNEFFDDIADLSIESARVVVPFVLNRFHPSSIVDFGCGTGAWLHVAKSLGISDVLGIDANKYDSCLLGGDEYVIKSFVEPVVVDHKFSLAMSLEVAEHLPESAADIFVTSVAGASDTILWSAAYPGQGGVAHINEQPVEYWVDKFASHGFIADHDFKGLFADDERVGWWYRKNIVVFSKTA